MLDANIMIASLQLWRDSRGRVSLLRIATLALMIWPIALAIAAWQTEIRFSARPVNDLIHRAGFWTLMFLLLSLAITPLRRIARWGALVDLRRMIGVAAFCYGMAHISLYVVDQTFDLATVASEIALRIYLTIGFTTLVGLGVLALTSTDGMVRELGGIRWRRLHQLVYVIAILALIHFFQQTKLDVSVPTIVAGMFSLADGLSASRLVVEEGPGELPTSSILALSVVASALTFAGEAIGIAIAFGVLAADGPADGVRHRSRQSRYGAAGLVRPARRPRRGRGRHRLRPLAPAPPTNAQAGPRIDAGHAGGRPGAQLGSVGWCVSRA